MRFITFVISSLALIACSGSSSSDNFSGAEGNFSKRRFYNIPGFEENRNELLARESVSARDFIVWSTDSAWSLPPFAQNALKRVRLSIDMPDGGTIFQKVISLEDIATYMNNTYGGKIGGFVAKASDVKKLSTMSDVYWGLRLDYPGSKFRENGGGYGVLRFCSDATSTLYIPFCSEMGGSQPHFWPNTGGGFTASTLSTGGYPEYVFEGYSAPRNGAELYEVTPQGREILRSRYVEGKGWQTNEIGVPAPDVQPRNGVYGDTKSGRLFVTTYAEYGGNRYIIRGEIDGEYHLTTTTKYPNVTGLIVVEKGIYGLNVPVAEVDRVWEESESI